MKSLPQGRPRRELVPLLNDEAEQMLGLYMQDTCTVAAIGELFGRSRDVVYRRIERARRNRRRAARARALEEMERKSK